MLPLEGVNRVARSVQVEGVGNSEQVFSIRFGLFLKIRVWVFYVGQRKNTASIRDRNRVGWR